MAIIRALSDPTKRNAWLNHLVPLWGTILLAVISLAGSALMKSKESDQLLIPTHTDLVLTLGFSLFSFWMWAMLTNAHCGALVSSSGKRKGKASERQSEFPWILWLAITHILIFILMNLPFTGLLQMVPWILLGISLYFPILVMGDPI